ncbi:HAMP domain-containing protein [Caloramator fervidus]|uniref:histidine kinase n=1 Tax=Caloramator fervidus TaxID=29344 RepID=A0A1H5XGP3_9CLOT|nr:ATP-binding protein [Caloramator fervidus]SEG10366.1 HAMP domain-containing protein [Caloramator fervidus]
MENKLRYRLVFSYFSIIFLLIFLINISIYFILQNFYIESKKSDILFAAKTVLDYIDVYSNKVDKEKIKQIQKDVYSKVVIIMDNKVLYNDFNKVISYNEFMKSEVFTKKINISGEDFYLLSYPIFKNGIHIGNVIFINPLEEALNRIMNIEKQILFVSFVILGIVFLYSFYISKTIVTPLNTVVDAIENLKDDIVLREIKVDGYKEIRRLCQAFNEMNKRIVELDKKRRQFVADASHELKSPLAGMKVLVESLIQGGFEDKAVRDEFLQSINKEIDRLSKLVNGLLELAQIENADELKMTSLNIKELLKEVIKSLEPIAKSKNISIYLNGDGIILNLNRDNMFRALYNLIENAIKYSNENSKIDILIERDDVAKITIRDYGIGIPEEDLPYIFDRFYRVDKTRARKTGGAGLGLSIVKHIIKLHKGDIEVKSKVGEGTAFIIKLPLEV